MFQPLIVPLVLCGFWRAYRSIRSSGAWPKKQIFALLATLALGFAVSAQTSYRHPSGSFSVTVPPGWQSETAPQGNGARISNGGSSVTIWFDSTSDRTTAQAEDLLSDA